jgi:hypothetical protein
VGACGSRSILDLVVKRKLISRSRLGCQVFLTREVDGLVAKLPSATRNMYVDGESWLNSHESSC